MVLVLLCSFACRLFDAVSVDVLESRPNVNSKLITLCHQCRQCSLACCTDCVLNCLLIDRTTQLFDAGSNSFTVSHNSPRVQKNKYVVGYLCSWSVSPIVIFISIGYNLPLPVPICSNFGLIGFGSLEVEFIYRHALYRDVPRILPWCKAMLLGLVKYHGTLPYWILLLGNRNPTMTTVFTVSLTHSRTHLVTATAKSRLNPWLKDHWPQAPGMHYPMIILVWHRVWAAAECWMCVKLLTNDS